MSLDVYLTDQDGVDVFSANITHNLTEMAEAAGIYKCLWRPDENGMTRASDIVMPLSAGIAVMVLQYERFEKFNSPNEWGMLEHFLPWCLKYLMACHNNPDATIQVSR